MPVTADAYDPGCGTDGRCTPSGFIAKFSPTGTLLASTFFEGVRAVQLASDEKVVVIGTSWSRDFPLVDAPPHPRTPSLFFGLMYVSVFDKGLASLVRSGFVADQQYLPAQGILAVRDGFAFVAAQVGPQAGMSA